MKSIARRFNRLRIEHPYWSTIICFNEAIRGQKFRSSLVLRWFNKLVNKNDYSKSDKKDIAAYLKKLSNIAEDDQKWG